MTIEIGSKVKILQAGKATQAGWGINRTMKKQVGEVGSVIDSRGLKAWAVEHDGQAWAWHEDDLEEILEVAPPEVALPIQKFYMIMRDDAKECHKKHLTYCDAVDEATRLAKKVPGHTFFIMASTVAFTQPLAPLEIEMINQ